MLRQVLSKNTSLRNRQDEMTLGISLPIIVVVQSALAILRLDIVAATNAQFDDPVQVSVSSLQ